MHYERTLRSLRADGARFVSTTMACAVVLLVAWGLWLALAHMDLREVSDSGRLVAERTPHTVSTTTAGKVRASYLRLGARVRQGDVLLELDHTSADHELASARALSAGIDAQLRSVRAEMERLRGVAEEAEHMLQGVRHQHKARRRFNRARLKLAEERSERLHALSERGVVGDLEYMEENARLEQERATLAGSRWSGAVSEAELRIQSITHDMELQRLAREEHRLSAEQEAATHAVMRAQLALDQHFVRAPVEGVLGDTVSITTGAFVGMGERLATVIPEGPVRAQGFFAAATAVGRIRVGQRAVLRVQSHPWTQYGTLEARVTRVSTEPRDGLVQVELTLLGGSTRIPVAHGLATRIEVHTERLPIGEFLLRSAGKLVGVGAAPARAPGARS